MIYKNILFYDGNFYTEKKNIKISYTHNRLKNDEYQFIPLDILDIDINNNNTPIKLDMIIVLLDHFHFNSAHNMWDHLYPSWYMLLRSGLINNFTYMTQKPLTDIFGIKHKELIEKISGNKHITLQEFKNKFNNPIIIPWLITGLEGIGIGHVNKHNLTVSRGLEINNIDPIEKFVDRIYYKYNIKRNSLVNNLDICNNIIFIKNKRTMNGIEELFNKLNIKYNKQYNFKIIDYSEYSFDEQLGILNTTCVCITGVGSARFNTPFLPNGAIEIQTFQPNPHRKNFIEYVDYHGGTLSKNHKVMNIPYYTQEEANNKKCSHLLEEYIDTAVKNIPCKFPINLEDNIPKEILGLRYHKNYDTLFDKWRDSMSNRIDEFIDMLN